MLFDAMNDGSQSNTITMVFHRPPEQWYAILPGLIPLRPNRSFTLTL